MKSRSREGAWIEIQITTIAIVVVCVAPVRERGLKLLASYNSASLLLVAPVRERGLKYNAL